MTCAHFPVNDLGAVLACGRDQEQGLFVEFPAAVEVMGSFCPAIRSMFRALAVAMGGGLSPSIWTPIDPPRW